MRQTRRQVLALGVGLAATLRLGAAWASAPDLVEITMSGSEDGARVWFEPRGLLVAPGATVRWTNNDPGNAHTATAYHPAVAPDRPRRIPEAAEPWDSDYLMPGESFEVTLTVPGVYDYFCVPHEQAGMVGRIVVGAPDDDAFTDAGMPEAALAGFPAVDEIVARGAVGGAPGHGAAHGGGHGNGGQP